MVWRLTNIHAWSLLCLWTVACSGDVANTPVAATFPKASQSALAPAGTWPAWQRDVFHRAATNTLVNTDGQVRWQLPLGAAAVGSPVVATDGTILVVTQTALVAVRADGTERWRLTLDASGTRTTPVLADDGSVFVADRTRARKVLLSNGAPVWNVALPCPAQHALSLLATAVLVPTTCGLRALNPANGVLLWSFGGAMDEVSSPAQFSNGALVLTDATGTITSLTAAGALRWSTPLGLELSAATVLQDGRVATLGVDGQVYIFDAAGNLESVFSAVTDLCGGATRSSAVSQALDGSLRVLGCDGFPFGGSVVVALNLDGTEQFRTPIGAQLDGNTAAVGADSTTLLATLDGFAALLGTDGQPLWVAPTGPSVGSPAVSADGVADVADQNGTLTALGRQCTAQCFNRACGSDLCGGSCGACNTPPQCFAGPGLCDATSGTCSYPNTLDGTSCTDGQGCTQGDVCSGGVCLSGPAPCADANTCTDDACTPDLTTFGTSSAAFEDISSFGTTTVDGDDAITGPIPLGFTLDFFGIPVDTVFISTNGFVGLDGVDSFSNTSIADPNQPNGMLAAFWDDLSANPGAVRFARLGTAPGRRFIAQWTNVQILNVPGTNLTFQVVIEEATGGVEFRYARLAGLPRNRARGNGATVGIEALDGFQGALFSFNRASLNVGTTLVWNREAFACSNPPVPPGSPCDDGTACTGGDACQDTMCLGVPITCAPPGPCQDAPTCDPFSGVCNYPPLPNGTACTVPNACQTGACSSGTCVGSIPLTCPPPPTACQVSQCDPATGGCILIPTPPGGACDDANACTFGDTCDGAGGCSGTAYSCTATTCESASSCDGTGGCLSTPIPDGTPCANNQGCSQGDVCISGACAAGPPLVCPSSTCSTSACVPDDLGRFVLGSAPLLDISATGTPSVSGDDELSDSIPLGFTFRFLGVDHTTVRLSTNGYITFGTEERFTNASIPTPGGVNGFLAPFWDDLLVNPGQLTFATVGQPPHQRFVAQWTGVDFFGAETGALTFQVILTNGTNGVEFRYGSLTSTNPTVALGGRATVGVEALDGASGLQFSFNRPALVEFSSLTWDRERAGCRDTPQPDGTMCTDGDACTTGDMCIMGSCQGRTTTSCVAPGECLAAQCDATSGACLITPVLDGTPCSVGACLMGACIRGADGGVAFDAGVAVDAGRVDAGTRPDSGVAFDAGTRPDSGVALDAGTRPDSGIALDAGTRPDSGVAFDAGTRPDSGVAFDAGTRPDASVTSDAGTRPDASVTSDAGTRPDASVASDGGTRPDAAVTSDAGTRPDASVTADAGTRPDAAVTADGGVVMTDAGSPQDAAGVDAAGKDAGPLPDGAMQTDGAVVVDGGDIPDAARDADGNVIAVDAGTVVTPATPLPPFVYVDSGGCSHSALPAKAPAAPAGLLLLAFLRARRRR